MGQNLSFITIDSVIKDYLGEGEYDQHKYFKVWHIAFRGFEDLGIDFFYQVKAIKLPILDNMTVYLPEDYLNWTKVGVLNDRGEIIPLYYNDKLTTYADFSPDRIEKTTDDTLFDWNEWGVNTWMNYWNGYNYVNVYGVPSGAPFVGNFKIDTATGLIILNQNYGYNYLMLEYVASPKQGQEYYLPVQFREALLSWIWWKDSKAASVRRGQIGIMRDLKSDYYRERRNAIAKYKPIRKQEAYQASQEQTRLAVKS